MKPEEAIEIIESAKQFYKPKIVSEAFETAITALKEIQRYREIGTVEECREAVEKQKPKKPKDVEYDYSYFVCDACGGWIYVSDDFESHHYCLNCGQAIQWDEDLEETEDEL